MINKFYWFPRKNIVVLKGILKEEVKNSKVIKADSDGNHFIDDYKYYVHDFGPDVQADFEIGSEIFCNYANIKIIYGTTDRKADETYFYIMDQLIDFYKVPEQTIK